MMYTFVDGLLYIIGSLCPIVSSYGLLFLVISIKIT